MMSRPSRYSIYRSINLVVRSNIKEDNLIVQLHIDHPDITSHRKGTPSLQTSAKCMVIKRPPSFTYKKEFIALAKLPNQFWLRLYTLFVVFFKIAVKNYRLHRDSR